MHETLTLLKCVDNIILSKLNKTFGSYLQNFPVCKALCSADPERNTGTIHKSNSEHLQSETPPGF